MRQRESQEAVEARELDPLGPIMERYQAGEIEAFDRLYEALEPPLRGFLRRLAPPGTDADDLVQTTFLQLHRARASYTPGRPVRPWAYAIARHVALMARRKSVRSTMQETPIEDQVVELSAPSGSVTETVDRVTLERALATIAEPGREALWLHHVAGLSFREVAAVQGVRESAAKVRAHRALASLRERYSPGEGS